MTTAADLIQEALEELQVYAPGQPISSADAARGLSQLNAMIDSWNIEPLACYAVQEQSVVLVPGKSSYTIGTGGDINLPRPQDIITGFGAAYIQDTLGNNFSVEVIQKDRWNTIGNRTTSSQIPDTLFYDPQYPLGIINIFPTPLLSYTVFFDSTLPQQSFSTLQTVLNAPPGYKDAIQKNLTVRLKPFFKVGPIDPYIMEQARLLLGNVKRSNIKPVESIYEKEIVAKGAGSYNIYRDSNNSP